MIFPFSTFSFCFASLRHCDGAEKNIFMVVSWAHKWMPHIHVCETALLAGSLCMQKKKVKYKMTLLSLALPPTVGCCHRRHISSFSFHLMSDKIEKCAVIFPPFRFCSFLASNEITFEVFSHEILFSHLSVWSNACLFHVSRHFWFYFSSEWFLGIFFYCWWNSTSFDTLQSK